MRMAFNADGCDVFDDIIIQVEHKKHITTYFIQLKYGEAAKPLTYSELTNPEKAKGKFCIETYYNGYEIVKRAFGDKTNSNVLRYIKNIDDTRFILFTNRSSKNVKDNLIENNQNAEEILINTKGKVQRFDAAKHTNYDTAFLNKYYLFSDQVSIEKTQEYISTAILNLLPLIKIPLETLNEITNRYISWIATWSSGEFGGHFLLTKDHVSKKLLELFIANYKIPFFHGIHRNEGIFKVDIWNKIVSEYITVVPYYNKNIDKYLQHYISDQILNVLSKPANVKTWTTTVSKNNVKTFFKSKIKTSMLVKDDDIRNVRDLYKILWILEDIPLVLEISNVQDYKNLIHILSLNDFKNRIILINQTNEKFQNISKSSTLFTNIKDMKSEEIKLLYNEKVNFRNKVIKLEEILEDKKIFKQVLTSADVIEILSGNFRIGKPPLLMENYIVQSVSKTYLNYQVLSQENLSKFNDVFIVNCKNSHFFFKWVYSIHLKLDRSGVETHENLKKSKRIPRICRILITENSCFKYWTKLHNATPLHELKIDEVGLEWIQSIGNINNIRNYKMAQMGSSNILTTSENAIYFNKPILLYSGTPGIGKSTLMDYFENTLSPDCWILRINFGELAEYYNSEIYQIYYADAQKQLEYLNIHDLKKHYCCNNFNIIIFKHFLKMKKVILLLDGYDEIPLTEKCKMSNIINGIQKMNFQIILSSRHMDVPDLEQKFNTLSNEVQPFTINSQKEYLINYLESNFPSTAYSDIKTVEFVCILLQLSTKLFKDKNFTGIPLLTMLLAESFSDEYAEYVKTGKNNINKNINVLHLYETFTEKKSKILVSKTSTREQSIYSSFKNIQQLYALKLLFNEDDLVGLNINESLSVINELIPNLKELIQGNGVITKGSTDNVQFIHRTFAEFLAAEWLATNVVGKYKNITKKLIIIAFNPVYDNLRIFFDGILARDLPLHTAVLDSCKEKVEQELKLHDFYARDLLGRTALHLAASWGIRHIMPEKGFEINDIEHSVREQNDSEDIVKILLEKYYDVKEDFLLNYTPLTYAIMTNSLINAELIVSFANGNLRLPHMEHIEPYLYYCSAYGYNSLLKSLLEIIPRDQRRILLDKPLDVGKKQNSLLWAATSCRADTVSLLLDYEADINAVNVEGRNALQQAVRCSTKKFSLNTLKSLISRGIDINHVDKLKQNALLDAVRYHCRNPIVIDILTLLVENDIDVNAKNSLGTTALHVACLTGQKDVANFLLANGANLNHDNEPKSPLDSAIIGKNIDIIKILLQYNAKINEDTRYNDGYILDRACSTGKLDIVRLLLDHGAKYNPRSILPKAAATGNIKILKLLLSRGAEINGSSSEGRIALFSAIKNDHLHIVKFLLSKGIDVNKNDRSRVSALEYALSNDKVDIAKLLLEKGAKINEHFLSAALRNNYFLNFPQLLSKKYINFKFCDGKTTMHIGADVGSYKTVEFLINAGVNVNEKDNNGLTPLFEAIRSESVDTVRLLLAHGADVNVRNNCNSTPLHFAATNNTGILPLLLSEANDINARNALGLTPLYKAMISRKNVELLISSGGDVNIPTLEGRTVIHEASRNGNKELLEILFPKFTLDINEKEREFGFTALHDACCGGNLDCISWLLNHGADINATNNDGQTPLDIATNMRNVDVIEFLLCIGATTGTNYENVKTAR